MTKEERKVIFAASLGTVFEWHDFYSYGSLTATIAENFFSDVNLTAAFIFALLAFAARFAVRSFDALVFRRLGDLVGRKYIFLISIFIMGLSTFLVGVLPTYSSIGIAAPIILSILLLAQGLGLELGALRVRVVGAHAAPSWGTQQPLRSLKHRHVALVGAMAVVLACAVLLVRARKPQGSNFGASDNPGESVTLRPLQQQGQNAWADDWEVRWRT